MTAADCMEINLGEYIELSAVSCKNVIGAGTCDSAVAGRMAFGLLMFFCSTVLTGEGFGVAVGMLSTLGVDEGSRPPANPIWMGIRTV